MYEKKSYANIDLAFMKFANQIYTFYSYKTFYPVHKDQVFTYLKLNLDYNT